MNAAGCPLRAQRQRALMAGARHPASPDAELFAALIAERDSRRELALLGLARAQLDALLARHFPDCPQPLVSAPPPAIIVIDGAHATFVATLRALLLRDASAAVRADDAECVAAIVAHASLRPDHLWRDLGLDGRDGVSAMLARYVPRFAARNTGNLRWKKFFALEVAQALGHAAGPAPGCPGCEDYRVCFPDSAAA